MTIVLRALSFSFSPASPAQHKESTVEERGNRTLLSFEWLTKSDDRVAGVRFVLITGMNLQTELDDTKHYYQF